MKESDRKEEEKKKLLCWERERGGKKASGKGVQEPRHVLKGAEELLRLAATLFFHAEKADAPVNFFFSAAARTSTGDLAAPSEGPPGKMDANARHSSCAR